MPVTPEFWGQREVDLESLLEGQSGQNGKFSE